MMFPQVELEEWCSTYGLKVLEKQCQGCKKYFPVDIPFAIKGYRGLSMKDHGCGDDFGVSVVVPVGDKKDKWRELLFGE